MFTVTVTVTVSDRSYEMSSEEAMKVEAKIQSILSKRWSDDLVIEEVENILSAMQDTEPNSDPTRLTPWFYHPTSQRNYFNYSYILEELRGIIPNMSSKRLTKILAIMGYSAPWDTNRRIYNKKAMRWISL